MFGAAQRSVRWVLLVLLCAASAGTTEQQTCGVGAERGSCDIRLEPCARGRERVLPVLFAEHASELQLARSVASVQGLAPACVCVASEQAQALARSVLNTSHAAAALRVDSEDAGYRDACLRACLGSLPGACTAYVYALVLAHSQMLVLTPGEALADTSHDGVPEDARGAIGEALDAALASQHEGYQLWTLTFTAQERAAFPALLRADVPWTYDTERAVWHGGSAPDVLHSRAFSVLVDDSKRYFVDNLQRYKANVALLERRLEARPNDADAVFYLAHTLKDAGAYTRALPLFERHASLTGMHAGTDQEFLSHLLSGRIHALRGRRYAAVACYLRAVETLPKRRVEALVELAQMWRQAGEPQQALAYARIAATAVQQDGKPSGEVLYPNSMAYDVSADMEVSLSAYELNADLDGVAAITRLLSRASIGRSYWLASYDNAAAFIERMRSRALSDAEGAALAALQAVMEPSPPVCERERVSLYGAPVYPSDGTACGPGSIMGSLFSSVAVVTMPSREQHVARFLTSLGCAHYLRFPAVMRLTPVELLRDHHPRLRNGEMRLIQAHLCVLSYIANLAHDARPVAIFEDDVELVPPASLPMTQHMLTRFASAFQEVRADTVLLGHCPFGPVVSTLSPDELVQPSELHVEALCTHAYAITPAAAARAHHHLSQPGYTAQLDVMYMRMAQRGELRTYTNAGDTVFSQRQLADSLNGPELKGSDETGPPASFAPMDGALRLATLGPSAMLHDMWLLQLVLQNVTGHSIEVVDASRIADADVILVPSTSDARTTEAAVALHSRAVFILHAGAAHDSVANPLASVVDLTLGHQPSSDARAFVHFPSWLSLALVRRSAAPLLEAVAFHPGLRQPAIDAEAWALRPHVGAWLGAVVAEPERQLVDLLSSVFDSIDVVPDACELHELLRYRCAIFANAAHLPLVHLASGVPILTGMTDNDSAVWNMRRLLVYGQNASSAELLRTMLLLQNDATFRAEWFRQPVLAPDADAWLQAFLSDVRARLSGALVAKGIALAEANKEAPLPTLPTTVVSGYWEIKSKFSPQSYRAWFNNTLRINTGMVFFYHDEEVRTAVAGIRLGLPTVFMKLALGDFAVAPLYNPVWVHAVHVPSRELGMIWLEKVYMVQRAAAANPFSSSWFAWMDAGTAAYRERPQGDAPWPAERALARLPRDRIVYTHVDEWYHHYSGTAYMYHADMVGPVVERFESEIKRCAATLNAWPCGNDQYLMTQMLDRHPAEFHKLGDGYGELMPLLAAAPSGE